MHLFHTPSVRLRLAACFVRNEYQLVFTIPLSRPVVKTSRRNSRIIPYESQIKAESKRRNDLVDFNLKSTRRNRAVRRIRRSMTLHAGHDISPAENGALPTAADGSVRAAGRRLKKCRHPIAGRGRSRAQTAADAPVPHCGGRKPGADIAPGVFRRVFLIRLLTSASLPAYTWAETLQLRRPSFIAAANESASWRGVHDLPDV